MFARTLAAAGLTAGLLGASTIAPAVAAPVLAPADATAHAAPTGITPAAWYVDHTQRRVFTVRLNRPLCDGSVSVTLYGPGGKLVDWLYEPVSSCRTSVVFDENMYDWQAHGALGAGSAKVEVSDYDSDGLADVVRSFPFYLKAAATQSVSATRSGRYVTVSGTTRRYDLRSGWDAAWVSAGGATVQLQRLSGTTWKTIATTRTTSRGAASVRITAPSRATYRLLYPGTTTTASAGSAKVVK